MSDHPQHVWHLRADDTIRCAHQDCQAEPTELQAAEVLADVETRTAMRIDLDWRVR
jgi:hypothetical protein